MHPEADPEPDLDPYPVHLSVLRCTPEERARITEDMLRVGATKLTRERLVGEVSYYSLLLEHGIRAPCRPGRCEAGRRVWDAERYYRHCPRCGALNVEEVE